MAQGKEVSEWTYEYNEPSNLYIIKRGDESVTTMSDGDKASWVCDMANRLSALEKREKKLTEGLNKIDDTLWKLEDYTHGVVGDEITGLRSLINKLLTK